MNTRILVSIALSLLIGAGIGYSVSLPQISALQSAIFGLEREISRLTTDYDNLNTTYNQLTTDCTNLNEAYNELQTAYSNLNITCNQLEASYNNLDTTYNQLRDSYDSLNASYNYLNESYVELSQQYEDLLFHYNLINGPASNFTTIDDLQITFTTHRTTYYYKDSISGNVTITHLNGTVFNGKFDVHIQPEFGGYSAVETGSYDVNGYGEFLVEPPYSFLYGPGIYTIYLGRITTFEDYVVAVGHELDGTAVQVEAK